MKHNIYKVREDISGDFSLLKYNYNKENRKKYFYGGMAACFLPCVFSSWLARQTSHIFLFLSLPSHMKSFSMPHNLSLPSFTHEDFLFSFYPPKLSSTFPLPFSFSHFPSFCFPSSSFPPSFLHGCRLYFPSSLLIFPSPLPLFSFFQLSSTFPLPFSFFPSPFYTVVSSSPPSFLRSCLLLPPTPLLRGCPLLSSPTPSHFYTVVACTFPLRFSFFHFPFCLFPLSFLHGYLFFPSPLSPFYTVVSSSPLP